MCKEFSCDIGDVFVLCVILYSLVKETLVGFCKFHVINTNAVVGKGFSMNISDCSANLKELFILFHGFLVLSKVVVEHSSTVVGSAFVSWLSSSLASKSKDLVVFQSFLSRDSIVSIRVWHLKCWVIELSRLVNLFRLFHQSFSAYNVLFSPWSVEVDRQLNSLGLVDSQRQVAFLLQVLESEAS